VSLHLKPLLVACIACGVVMVGIVLSHKGKIVSHTRCSEEWSFRCVCGAVVSTGVTAVNPMRPSVSLLPPYKSECKDEACMENDDKS
jgi:hypothetical protein